MRRIGVLIAAAVTMTACSSSSGTEPKDTDSQSTSSRPTVSADAAAATMYQSLSALIRANWPNQTNGCEPAKITDSKATIDVGGVPYPLELDGVQTDAPKPKVTTLFPNATQYVGIFCQGGITLIGAPNRSVDPQALASSNGRLLVSVDYVIGFNYNYDAARLCEIKSTAGRNDLEVWYDGQKQSC